MNIILNTDSYKASHYAQYPDGVRNISSYIEARAGGDLDEVCFFGLQAFLQEYLSKPITLRDIDEAEKVLTAHGVPFHKEGWDHIVRKHGGYLPLYIKALPEGSVVPCGTPLVQVETTDPECAWLVSYIETALLRAVWYPTTVASYSREVKKVLKSYLDETSDNADTVIPFMLHDFGARGVSSNESAAVGGGAHLVNFMGTDTVASLPWLREHYGIEMAGFSVPASEHSTMTSWGEENEADAYANMIDKFDGPGAIVSIVSDSYDLYNAIDNIFGGELKEKVLGMKGRLVVRPDSGDPMEVSMASVYKLGNAFGYTTNSKGYRVLNDKVRVLWGDGVNKDDIDKILAGLRKIGWSAENMVFGMGGGLLQAHTRDTARFAQKCNAMQDKDGVWHDVCKKPKTDGTKASKAGRQVVLKDADGNWTAAKLTDENQALDELEIAYYKQGSSDVTIRRQSFDSIRERAAL